MKVKAEKHYHRSDAIEIRINNDILQCIVFETYGALPLQTRLMLHLTLILIQTKE
jgi:hypothetical protein